MRASATDDNGPLFNYTLMPAHMRDMFPVQELAAAELASPFSFTKGCRLMRTPRLKPPPSISFETLLFDLEGDEWQRRPLSDAGVEDRMSGLMRGLMRDCDAPGEQYERLGL